MATSSDASDSSPIIRPQRNIETVIIKPRDDVLHGKRAVLFALGANLFIGSMKLLVGMAGRQSAVLSEAMHSFADAINSGFLLIGLQKGQPDGRQNPPLRVRAGNDPVGDDCQFTHACPGILVDLPGDQPDSASGAPGQLRDFRLCPDCQRFPGNERGECRRQYSFKREKYYRARVAEKNYPGRSAC